MIFADSLDFRVASMLRKVITPMLSIILCALSLAACLPGSQCEEAIEAADNAVCNASRLSAGTTDYVRCRQKLEQIRTEAAMAEASAPHKGRSAVVCQSGAPLSWLLKPE